jgi:ABC-type sugar transport system permease subunit
MKKQIKKKFDWKEKGFIYAIIILPIIQFCIFYIYVNFNSILLAFKEYTAGTDPFIPATTEWVWFKNFGNVLKDIFASGGDLFFMTKNSFIVYITTILFMPVQWLVSYALWRKVPGSSFFQVILFLPSMITGVIWVTIAQFIFEGITVVDLLGDTHALSTMIGYSFFLGFAGGMIMYLGSMSGISPSVVESAKLDGATDIVIFRKIVFPSIFPMITTFLVTGVAGFFSNALSLHAFYGAAAPESSWTLGYYFFIQVIGKSALPFYPYAAAAGILFTVIAAPITLLAKHLLEKYGPSED